MLSACSRKQRMDLGMEFHKVILYFCGGPGNVPTCAGQALSHIAETFNPFTPSVSTATAAAAPVAQDGWPTFALFAKVCAVSHTAFRRSVGRFNDDSPRVCICAVEARLQEVGLL
jgi:hypothetical protein